jgi:hypothetical protein
MADSRENMLMHLKRREDRRMDQDVVGRLMDDMDPRLVEFLRTKVNSFVKWDLIRFFHQHPDITDTAEHIAQYARQDVGTTRAELAELAGQQILVQDQMGGLATYSLSKDPAIRDMIRRLVEASEDRRFRVKAIYHIIRNMQ